MGYGAVLKAGEIAADGSSTIKNFVPVYMQK
jgi:hypothetical protein